MYITFNKLFYSSSLLIFSLLLFSTPEEVSAVPAFARQTNMVCSSCHFQHFPALNSFGRSFRASGYTMTGGQGMIESDNTSLPVMLNASIIAKLRYNKSNGNTNIGTDHGEIQWPDEAALLIGGKLAKNVGFLMELGLGDVASETEGQTTTANSFLSTKLHFEVADFDGTKISVIPFSTDGLGVAYGFELLNTGAQRSQRPIEERKGFSAAQALGLGSGEATGIALVASRHDFFVNYTPWVPGWGGTHTTVKPSGLAHYFRAAYMPAIGNWDTGAGIQLWSGAANVSDDVGGETEIETDGWVIDAQAQGSVAHMPLGLYASYGQCKGSDNHFSSNCSNSNKADSYAFLGQLGILSKVDIYAAYRTLDDGAVVNSRFNSFTLGGNYMYSQNIRFESYVVKESGSGVDARTSEQDSKFLLQLFVGF
ncbi:MAG: hypothetical protein QM504_18180 [Pseudomonadota bacterium]